MKQGILRVILKAYSSVTTRLEEHNQSNVSSVIA
jgi:hypothetical protein